MDRLLICPAPSITVSPYKLPRFGLTKCTTFLLPSSLCELPSSKFSASLTTPLRAVQSDPPDPHHTPAPLSAVQESDHPQWPQMAAQLLLWILLGVYVLWLFILPYAPGDPVWAIKPYTISMLLDLSLNFFYILPLTNIFGFHLLESPAVHPTAEALFNLVMAWTVMFAPLLFTDRRRNKNSGSLVILWTIQMFLTNTILIPYMASRQNQENRREQIFSESKLIKMNFSGVRTVMTSGAKVVGSICGAVGLISVMWFFIGRPEDGYGNFSNRWTFFLEYLASDRPGYAFIWDICLYSIFQPWLIGDNLLNVEKDKVEVIRVLRFVPYIGLTAYLWGLDNKEAKNF